MSDTLLSTHGLVARYGDCAVEQARVIVPARSWP